MVFLAGLAQAQSNNPEISFAVTREDGFIQTEASADFEAIPASLVWTVLTDYEGYPRFISSMRESKIVRRNPGELIVEQKGNFSFLFFSRDIEARIRVSELPPGTIESHALDGDFDVMDGHYELQQIGNRVHLSFAGRLRPKFSLPPLFGTSIARSVLLRNFKEMVGEILRQDAEIREARRTER